MVEALEELQIDHAIVRTAPASSAEESAQLQEIELEQLLKTIVVRRGEGDHVFVLVPGDREIDWKKLRKHLGVSRVSLPSREDAERVTGYGVGTITPFGSVTALPIIIDEGAMSQEKVALGAGERGVNVHVAPASLAELPEAGTADVTGPQRSR